MILDCCHSASGTRTQDLLAQGLLPDPKLYRGVDISAPVSADLDREIWGDDAYESILTRAPAIANGCFKTALYSHVLLAGCNSDQKAKDGGAFTDALLNMLRREGLERLSYADLMRQLPRIHK